MARSRTERFSSLLLTIVVFAVVAATMAGCGSDETALNEVPSDQAAAVGTAAAAAPTQPKVPEAPTMIAVKDTYGWGTPGFIDASRSTVPVEVLPATSATCVTLAKLKEINNRSDSLATKFSKRVFEAVYDDDTTDVERRWEEARRGFAADTESVLAELSEVYANLANEQPQFATDSETVNEWTGKRLRTLARIRFGDIGNLESITAEAVASEAALRAAHSRLKIDDFARSKCGIALVNT